MKTSPIPELSPKQKARYDAQVAVAGADECWLWTGPKQQSPCPEFRTLTGKFFTSHVALALAGKVRPEGKHALHSCDNRLCCNPAHLRWGTQRENMEDKVARGRTPRGSSSNKSKLCEADIPVIREAIKTESGIVLGKRYGVGPHSIYAIRDRRTWRHVA